MFYGLNTESNMLKLNQLFLKMKVNTCIDKPEAEFEKVLVIFIFVYVYM